MSLIFSLVRAGHARGTHHYLAFDALQRLRRPDAERWQRIFLKHAQLFAEGAKAPDTVFKDFKNHVLHPRDGYWGGAPEKARNWYFNLVEALGQHRWDTAAYCAGVLSHYVVDPLHPFHTAQSEAENNIHAACEWSINRDYARLKAEGEAAHPGLVVAMPTEDNWLALLICRGADKANQSYEKLIAHYDVHRGVVDPPSGLDTISRALVAELIVTAAETFALVLDKAISESRAEAPDIMLSLEGVLAAINIPINAVMKKIEDKAVRAQVERMYDELKATGTVEKNLTEDDRQIRDLYVREVLAKRAAPDAAKIFPFEPRQQVTTRIEQRRRADTLAGTMPKVADVVQMRQPVPPARPAPARREAEPPRPFPSIRPQRPAATGGAKPSTAASAMSAPAPQPAPAPAPRVAVTAALPQAKPAPGALRVRTVTSRPVAEPDAAPRIYLTLEQPIVHAPSIGPKMAERLNVVGIDTVDDLLKAHPIALAARLNDSRVTPEIVNDWQDQARLVCTVPTLRGTHAQLLVGAGYRTADAIAAADAEKLCADVLTFASSSDGQRILRDGSAPDVERIKAWLAHARAVKAA